MSIELSVTVHITFFYREFREKYLIQVINEYLSKWTVKMMDIYIHTNSESALSIKEKCIIPQYISLNFIRHSLENQDPFLLTWKCRTLLKQQKDIYDIYLYIEDDIGIPDKALQYWLKYKDSLHTSNIDVGFVLLEEKDAKLYCANILIPSKYPCKIVDRIFVWNHQNYCAFWICDKKEFSLFVESKFWNFHGIFPNGPENPSIFIAENSAIGFKMNYLGTWYPLEDSQISDICYVYHLPNNYVSNEKSEFGKFPVERITENLDLSVLYTFTKDTHNA